MDEGEKTKPAPRGITRRRFLKSATAALIAATLAGCSREEPSKSPSLAKTKAGTYSESEPDLSRDFDEVLQELAPEAKSTIIGGRRFKPSTTTKQEIVIDLESPLVQNFIAEARELVGGVGNRIAVANILVEHLRNRIRTNPDEKRGIQTMSEEIEEGGVCIGRAFLLGILMQLIIPEAKPRIVGAKVETDIGRIEHIRETIDMFKRSRQVPDSQITKVFMGAIGHAFVIFENNKNFHNRVMVADPMILGESVPFDQYKSLVRGLEILEIVRWDPGYEPPFNLA